MSDTPARGALSLLAFATAGSAIGSLSNTGTLFSTQHRALLVEFVRETVGLDQQIIDASGIRGDLSHKDTRTRFGVRSVGGQIVMQPSAIDLVNLGPILVGASTALDNAGPVAFDAAIGRDVKDFYYDNGKCTGFSMSSSVGGLLTLSMNCAFKDENGANSGAPYASGTLSGRSLTASTSQAPLMHFDTSGAILLDPAGTPFDLTAEEFSFSVDHGVMTDRFRNSKTATSFPAMDRVVSVAFNVPYNSEVAGASTLYPIPYAGYGATNAGRISVTYTNGDSSGLSAAFTFRVVKFNRRTPFANGRGEVMIPFVGRAFWDGSGRELVATLDGT